MSVLIAAYRLAQDLIVPERLVTRRFMRAAGRHAPADGAVGVDIGAGTGPYRKSLNALLGNDRPLLNLDIVHRDTTDLVADAGCLPLVSGCAASVSLFHVLQHVADPAVVLGEVARIGTAGALLIVDFPFMTCEGRSTDLRRWTLTGMKADVGRAGFEILDAAPVGGFFFLLTSTMADLPGRLLIRHAKGWQAGRGPMASLMLLLAFALALPFHVVGFLALALDRLLPASAYYAGGLVLARKKVGPE